ncbi:MAG: 2-dehydropantoate 2-reductase [Nitrospirota bacterium]
MTGNKILIVGAGAIGGYFGGCLCRAGADVTFLVRPQTYLQISKNGLTIRTPPGDFVVYPKIIREVAEISRVDLIILSVKCYDLQEVLRQVEPLVKSGATVLTLQNGIDSEEAAQAFYGQVAGVVPLAGVAPHCVVAGVVYITSRLAEPGVIEHFRRGTISLGECSGEKSERSQKIHALITQTGIPCRLTHQIMKEKWEKLCWNATFNPLSVILDHPLSLILKSEDLLEIVRQGIREIIAVAETENILLHTDIIEDTISATFALQTHHTSMYEDYKNGNQTEIEYLNGEIVRRGEKAGVPTPTNKMLYSLVKGLELRRKHVVEKGSGYI